MLDFLFSLWFYLRINNILTDQGIIRKDIHDEQLHQKRIKIAYTEMNLPPPLAKGVGGI
jgi:hypothetical protein